MSNLQTHYHFEFEVDFQKVDQHTGVKWLIYDTKRHRNNQSEVNMLNLIFKGNVQGRKHPGIHENKHFVSGCVFHMASNYVNRTCIFVLNIGMEIVSSSACCKHFTRVYYSRPANFPLWKDTVTYDIMRIPVMCREISLTRYFIPHDNSNGKTSVTLRTHEKIHNSPCASLVSYMKRVTAIYRECTVYLHTLVTSSEGENPLTYQ